jgi:ATP-binding cassette subfamily F protein 2
MSLGLISQVAEELWEVADKTIKNLTKHDISIIDYKKNLVKQSAFLPKFRSFK